MIDSIFQHTSFLQLLTSLAMAVIWVVYLQMLVTSVRRQRATVLTVNRGAGDGFAARVILANLSYEPVFVRDMIAVVHTAHGKVSSFVTDLEEYGQDDMSDELEGTVQGPLGMGDHVDMGSFEGILGRFDAGARPQRDDIRRIELIVVASRERLTGVRKGYDVHPGEGGVRVAPASYRVEKLSERQCWTVLKQMDHGPQNRAA